MLTESRFKPLWYLKNPHLQTLFANLIHPRFPDVEYETIDLPDGDNLDLAWGTGRGEAGVLILHGLEGSLHSAYAERLMNRLNDGGIPAAFMFFRGCHGRPNNKIESYHSGKTDDLAFVIQHLKRRGLTRIALVGYSLGGNVTLKYLGESEVDDSICGAVTTSVPMLLADCAERMNQGFSKFYQWELLSRLKRKVAQKKSMLEQHGLKTTTKHIRDFEAFDDAFTAPIHGFASGIDYYRQNSSRQFIKNIQLPTLIIHSRDDPFMTRLVIPGNPELSDSVTLELSDHGGHVGFISGDKLLPQPWLESRILEFIRPLLAM